VTTDIPTWAYVVATGLLFALAQRLTANILDTLERRLVKLETGAEVEEKTRRDRDHDIIKDLTVTTARVITLESDSKNCAIRLDKLERHNDRTN